MSAPDGFQEMPRVDRPPGIDLQWITARSDHLQRHMNRGWRKIEPRAFGGRFDRYVEPYEGMQLVWRAAK